MKTYPYPPLFAEEIDGPDGCVASDFSANFAALKRISFPPGRKILFLAADGRSISDDDFDHLAAQWLKAGVIYFCAWGPDCERLHDLFDDQVLDRSLTTAFKVRTDRAFVMTTWHANESLEEALHFFLHLASPADEVRDGSSEYKAAGRASCIALALGNSEWRDAIELALADPGSLKSM